MIHSRVFKDMLHLLKENKDLIQMIRKILEMFPEAVVIQSLDETMKKFIMKYANRNAMEHIVKSDYEEEEYLRKVKLVNGNEEISINDFLSQQNSKLEELNANQSSISAMIKIIKRPDSFERNSDEQNDSKYYNVKTMKVKWEKETEAFMTIFIDMTNVKKLEEEKAKYLCQKRMFASVSHEFRTPLNAFENSLELIKFKIDSISKAINIKDIENTKKSLVHQNILSIEKFIKMGKISSKLLVNLVEDILDLEKFDSGTFSLNIRKFKL
jgi:signal transduction histidine kinase